MLMCRHLYGGRIGSPNKGSHRGLHGRPAPRRNTERTRGRLYKTSLSEQHLAADNNNNNKRRKCRAGDSGALASLRRFLFSSHPSFQSFEVSVTFLSTSCFLRWETVPTLFELSDSSSPPPSSLLPPCGLKTPRGPLCTP